MKVVLYTVPGTGTRFVANILETVFGYEAVSLGRFKNSTPVAPVFWQVHTDPLESQHRLLDGTGGRFVTTLRDPVLAYLSRRRTMVSKTQEWLVEDSACRWRRLIAEAEKRKIICFRVDAPPHDRLENMLRLRLGLGDPRVNRQASDRLFEHWTPISESIVTMRKLEYLETGKIKGLDLAPLDAARGWVDMITGGSVSGLAPAKEG